MGGLQHQIECSRHIMGAGKRQEKHETLSRQFVHVLKIKDTRLHHICHTKLYGRCAALSFTQVKEVHITEPQAATQQHTQYVVASET